MFAMLLIIYIIALMAMIFTMHLVAVEKSEQEVIQKYHQEYRKAALYESKSDWRKMNRVNRSQLLFCMKEFK